MEKIWDVCLCVIDDIKEIVCILGEGLCRSVRLLILRLCDVYYSGLSEVKGIIGIVLLIMFECGLFFMVKEV